jgi:uroporphyrinogen decarboxylase
MNHRQRLQKCLANEKMDRPPVSLWRHFPVEDQDPALLSKAIVTFQNIYDFDFVKITPASSFCLRDWGLVDVWKGNPEGTRDIVMHPVREPEDWQRIKTLPIRNNLLSSHLECIRLTKENLPKTTPIIQTVFSPLAQAKNLVGKNNLPSHIRLYPQAIKSALRQITDTTIDFIKALTPLQIDGVFFAVQHAQASQLSKLEFEEFCLPYDLEILDYCKNYWLNVVHIHGQDIYFDAVSNYPCQVFNWHDQETQPDLISARSKIKGAVCGGLRQWDTMVNGSPEGIMNEAKRSIEKTNSERFILGTGCVLPITAPHSNIMAARRSVERSW